MVISRQLPFLLVAGLLLLPPIARADDASDIRTTVESFVSAFHTGDDKALRDHILAYPPPSPSLTASLDLLAATARLRKAALTRYGDSASEYFLGTSAAQFDSRLQAIREAPVKIAGRSAILTLPQDEKSKRPPESIILVRFNSTWKLDGNSLFKLDASVKKDASDIRLAMTAKLTAITDRMAQEITEDKYPDAVAALLEFWSRADAVARQSDAAAALAREKAAQAAATRPSTNPLPPTPAMSPRAAALSDKEIIPAINKAAEALLASLDREMADLKQPLSPAQLRERRFFNDRKNGEIALSIYAILTAGRVTGDPRFRASSREMAAPIEYLLTFREHETYTVALQALALSLLPNKPEFRRPLFAARDELLQGSQHGVYSYSTTRPPDTGDNSNTQYGQLGVWACQDVGLETPDTYWSAVDEYWRKTQSPSGGWGYTAIPVLNRSEPVFTSDAPYPSMTAAGVASLFLAQEYLDRSVVMVPKPDPALDLGIDWLTSHFDQYRNSFASDLYLAFSIERVALVGGIKNLGRNDWYREGAAAILDAQLPDNTWTYSRGSAAVATSYALLFLSRGIAPLACAKLQYPGPWNARPRDCARFVHWLDKKTERTLNWQTLPINSNPNDWRTPVLVISGHGDPKFSADQVATLRQYILAGGLILSTADGADPTFTKAIRTNYAPAIFKNLYEMRPLPLSHPIFQLDYKVKPPLQLHLLGLSNGTRECWIHSEDDLGAAWQAYATSKNQDFEIPANIYFYATGRSSSPLKLEPLDPPPPPPATATLNIARLSYSGNFDPEPAAWSRFAIDCRYQHHTILNAIPTPITDLDPAKTPIAHLTGTTPFTLTDPQKLKLLDFFDHGGTLLADATAGNDSFTTSFQTACQSLFPDSPLQPIPTDSSLLTGSIPGTSPLNDLERRHIPDSQESRSFTLLQIQRNNKPIILFSPGDLTAGLANLRTWGIVGYTPDSATALTWNSLLYLNSQAPPPSTQPTPATTAPADLHKPQSLIETYTTLSTPLNLLTPPR